jgi:hypothetical protein
MLFAVFMDFVVYPVIWVCSPKMREHQRTVRLQNDHLDGSLHYIPEPSCWYCRAREADRKAREG